MQHTTSKKLPTASSSRRLTILVLVCLVVVCQLLLLWYFFSVNYLRTGLLLDSTLVAGVAQLRGFRPTTSSLDSVKLDSVETTTAGNIDSQIDPRRTAYLSSRRGQARKGRFDDADSPILRSRRQEIQETVKLMFRSYMERAWGADEVGPISGQKKQPFGGQGTTILDSLSTLHILGLKEEFEAGRDWVANALDFDKIKSGYVSIFETNIRNVGGLLSAYDLTEDPVFLKQARHLAEKIMPAFRQSKTGVPPMAFNLQDNSTGDLYFGPDITSLADMGTFQLEMRYLSQVTGDREFANRADHIYQRIREARPLVGGLYATLYDVETGQFSSQQVALGGTADSFYEYLLKVYLQGGKKETWLADAWKAAMQGMRKFLLKEVPALSSSGHSRKDAMPIVTGAYVYHDGQVVSDWKMEELTCYLPGNLALGAAALTSDSVYAPIHTREEKKLLSLAERLGRTCFRMFNTTESGLSPEHYQFDTGGAASSMPTPVYKLRPETLESLFYLYELTGNPEYREMGWTIFKTIKDSCKSKYGWGEYQNVRVKRPSRTLDTTALETYLYDSQPSYIFAELFKYAYLLMDPYHTISLDDYTFNTEAHPLRVFSQLAPATAQHVHRRGTRHQE